MSIVDSSYQKYFCSYVSDDAREPLFLKGDALTILKALPDESIDMCMTSPPYWGKRQYTDEGLGLEDTYQEYIDKLSDVFYQVKRVLKQRGSFWLNIGDTYYNKSLLGIPWRVVLRLTDEQGWILRNSVVWNKIKGGLDNTTDKLRNVHEDVFHLVKIPKGYFYDVNAIRSNPKKSKVVNGSIISATGVSGVRYKRQIELSTSLTEKEKEEAHKALSLMLESLNRGEVADFRMIIRGQQRTTHSDSVKVSGRAKELRDKGFYFLKYHPNGSKPSDVWDIIPEDTQKREGHFAPYPKDLCRLPILATCPVSGVVLDPFSGTGTTMLVSYELGRKSVGIDVSEQYLSQAHMRWATSFRG